MSNQENHKLYPIFMIISPLSLVDIRDLLASYAKNESHIGPMHVDMRDGKETLRTIVMMASYVFYKVEEDQKLVIFPYSLRRYNFPREFVSKDLFVRIPMDITISNARENLISLCNDLVAFGVIEPESYNVRIPLESRVGTGIHRGISYISFNTDNIDAIAYCLVIINHSVWNVNDSTYIISASWSKSTFTGSNKQQIE